MKFRIYLNHAFTGKRVKQKTFTASDWDKAEQFAEKFWREYEEATGVPTSMGLSRIYKAE